MEIAAKVMSANDKDRKQQEDLPTGAEGEASSAGIPKSKSILAFEGSEAGATYERGDSFSIPVWSIKSIRDLERILLGDKDLEVLARRPVQPNEDEWVLEARVALMRAAAPLLYEQGKLGGKGNTPVDLADDAYSEVCWVIGCLLYLRLFEEAGVLIDAVRRLHSPLELWSNLPQKAKSQLKAVVARAEREGSGLMPTKKEIRIAVFGEGVDTGQASRILSKMAAYRDLPGGKTGPRTDG